MKTCTICGLPESPERYTLKHTPLSLACMGTDWLCTRCYVWGDAVLRMLETSQTLRSLSLWLWR